MATFETMALENWSLEHIQSCGAMLSAYPLHPTRSDVSDALRSYFLEYFNTIFPHVNGAPLEEEASKELLQPFIQMISQVKKKPIISMAESFLKSLKNDASLSVRFDLKAIGALALSLGEKPEIPAHNRRLLYSASQTLQES